MNSNVKLLNVFRVILALGSIGLAQPIRAQMPPAEYWDTLQRMEAGLASAQEQLNAHVNAQAPLNAQKAALERELVYLQGDLSSAESRALSAANAANQAEHEWERANASFNTLNSQMESAKAQLSGLTNQVAELSSSISIQRDLVSMIYQAADDAFNEELRAWQEYEDYDPGTHVLDDSTSNSLRNLADTLDRAVSAWETVLANMERGIPQLEASVSSLENQVQWAQEYQNTSSNRAEDAYFLYIQAMDDVTMYSDVIHNLQDDIMGIDQQINSERIGIEAIMEECQRVIDWLRANPPQS